MPVACLGIFSFGSSLALSAQMYPAPIRATAHGISAATGKVGSILVVVWLNYLGNRNKFWITWPFALLGAVICWIFVADNTGLDLAEQVLGSAILLQLHFSVQSVSPMHVTCLYATLLLLPLLQSLLCIDGCSVCVHMLHTTCLGGQFAEGCQCVCCGMAT